MWEAVQLEMKRRKEFAKKYHIKKLDFATDNNPFAGRVICGCCGRVYGRKVWNSPSESLRRYIWQCSNKYVAKDVIVCRNKHIDDEDLYGSFVRSFNTVVENIESMMEKWKEQLISDCYLKRYKAQQFIEIFEKAVPLKEFEINLYFKMIEKMIVLKEKKITVTLLDGSEIKCTIE